MQRFKAKMQFTVAVFALATLLFGQFTHSPLHHLAESHSGESDSHAPVHKKSCCGHSHSHDHSHAQHESGQQDTPIPHEHGEHCHLCDLISAPVTVALPVSLEPPDLLGTSLILLPADWFESRVSAPAIARGPPIGV